MPSYGFRCGACANEFDVTMRMSEYRADQTCPSCGSTETSRKMTLTKVVYQGDGWVSKNHKVSVHMGEMRNVALKRQEERKRDAPDMRIAPNVAGEETGTWTEAVKLAKDKGFDTTEYQRRAQLEKKGEPV